MQRLTSRERAVLRKGWAIAARKRMKKTYIIDAAFLIFSVAMAFLFAVAVFAKMLGREYIIAGADVCMSLFYLCFSLYQIESNRASETERKASILAAYKDFHRIERLLRLIGHEIKEEE